MLWLITSSKKRYTKLWKSYELDGYPGFLFAVTWGLALCIVDYPQNRLPLDTTQIGSMNTYSTVHQTILTRMMAFLGCRYNDPLCRYLPSSSSSHISIRIVFWRLVQHLIQRWASRQLFYQGDMHINILFFSNSSMSSLTRTNQKLNIRLPKETNSTKYFVTVVRKRTSNQSITRKRADSISIGTK